MATTPQYAGASTRRAQMLRETWARVGSRGSATLKPVGSALKPVGSFLVAHPTLTQGGYYVLTGLWPLFSMGTFLAVTGPKTDLWLVRTVGTLIAVIGAALCLAAYRRRTSPEVLVLAFGAACALATIDLVFVWQRVIPPVYLLDAAAEVGLLTLWAYAWGQGRLTWSEERPFGTAPHSVAATPKTP